MSEDKAQPAELRWSGEPWDQQPHEPDLWHGRFKLYLEMGPTRSVSAVERAVVEKAGKEWVEAKGRYHFAARRWYWRQRANAWDVRQRELLALSERYTRVALRDRRLERMEDYLEAICDVLDTANITEVDEKQARAWLPQMRAFLRDLLVIERQEFERGDYERDDPNGGVTITADDLRAAQRALMAGQAATADRARELQLHEPPAGVFSGPAPVKVYEKYLFTCGRAGWRMRCCRR